MSEVRKRKRLSGYRIKHGLGELGDLDYETKPPPVVSSATPSSSEDDEPHYQLAGLVFGPDLDDWEEVMRVLFSVKESPPAKRNALTILHSWTFRERSDCHLPDYIVSTEILFGAMLLDEEDEVSSGDVHQLYGAAISRVVHVMTGSFSTGSATTYRQRAQKIGFPEEAVEVRQRVAHGALPSLSEMRWVAALTLQFLYKNYWQLQRKELMALKKRQVVKRKREEVEVKQDSGPTHSIDDIQSLLKAAQETLEDTVAEEQQPATTAQTGWTIS